ncbi:ATP-dependent RNA helicase MAK5 [Fusarium sp. LHS14.1]|nr:ATP-dependent RNA helicase MAK5 [Fusarium sp. LHS14.1]
MEYYDPEDVGPPKSPPLVPVRPELEPDPLNWRSDDETDLEDIIDSNAPWNRALRDRKRLHGRDGYMRKKNRQAADWKDGVLVHEMDPRRGWEVAAEAARVPLPADELDDWDGELEAQDFRQPAEDPLHFTSATPQAPRNTRPRTRRKRFALPLLVAHPSGTVTEVMACPDSGSDENIISLELVTSLGLKTETNSSDEPREFAVANGKIVTAVGQVSTSCRFATGTPSDITNLECIFHVFSTLAVPLIMGVDFLQQTETLSKHRDRLVEQVVPAMQSLRVNSVGRPKRSLVCRLDTYVGCATVDTGSDLDLVSPAFAEARAYTIEPAYEQLEFADCSVGYTSGVIKTSLAVGNVNYLGFHPRGEPIELEFHVLEDLNADILVGQDTVNVLDVFNLHSESLIPSMSRLGESDINIIRHVGSLEKGVTNLWDKFKRKFGGNSSDGVTGRAEAQVDINQQENARRERERARIAKLSGSDRQRAQELEDKTIQAFEYSLVPRCTSPLPTLRSVLGPISPGGDSPRSTAADCGSTDIDTDHESSDDDTPHTVGGGAYVCNFAGCTALPFQTQYLLNFHANVHASARPHYCPVTGCPRGEGGRGFKTKNEMIRHGLVHDSPGYTCPFCPDRDYKYPRPDNLQRHVRVHHVDKDKDDPVLRNIDLQLHHKHNLKLPPWNRISTAGVTGQQQKKERLDYRRSLDHPMVPPAKKRKLPATGPAPKRSKNISNSKKKTNKASRRAVDASALAWKSVGEDFGGLEVIEGVDVVKDGGRVQFLVAGETNTITNDDGNNDDDNEHADESFEGFGDDPVEVGDIDSGQASSGEAGLEGKKSEAKTTTKEEKANKKNKKQQRKLDASKKEDEQLVKTQKVVQKSSSRGGNTFDALADDQDQEEDVDVAAWVPLNLSPQIISAIAKLGFTKPTLIQEKTIPEIVAGEDVIGKAQTGSGKTLAFGIPMVERWLELYEQGVERTGPMAVVLSPTRELAKQLGDHLKALCDGLSNAPYVCVVTGGLSIQKQQRQLEKADIVIGTPGRLWEVLSGDATLQNTFSKIKFLVVDEADRLFKVGQFKEAEDIIGALDGKRPSDDADSSDEEDDEDEDDERSARQTLVFSATFDKDLQTKLAGKGKSTGSDEEKMAYLMKCLKFRGEPKFIDVNPVSQMADGLKEGLIECGAMEKDLYLYTVLILNPGRRTLVFTNSISAVRRLTPLLSNLNMTALPLHSQMAQKARLRSLERFTAARNSVLIATDVAARGLDIKEVDQVLHYHVPRSADTYIHRSGRTARGESSGVSVILCAPEEVLPTRRLASKVHAERSSGAKREHFIQTLPVDRKMASRLKPRVDLAKKIADSVLAKEKAHSDDTWLRNAADELGVEYDSDDLEAVNASGGGRGGRGGGRRRKEQAAKGLTKAEMGALRAQLREELSRRVNLGVSERYITGGRVDVGALLREGEKGGVFLGGMDGLGFE